MKPNKSDIGQAADQTAVLLFPLKIQVFFTIMRSNPRIINRSIACKVASTHSNGVRLAGVVRLAESWVAESHDVISGHLGRHISKTI